MYLFHCSGSSGLGAYLFSLQSAYAASVLTHRTLVVFCPFECEGNRITKHMYRYFNLSNTTHLNTSHYKHIRVTTWPGLKTNNIYNQTHVQGEFVGDKSIVYFNDEHTVIDKIFKKRGFAKYNDNEQRLGSTCVKILCFMQPTLKLLTLFRSFSFTKNEMFVIHVRMGDKFMSHSKDYVFKDHETKFPMDKIFARLFTCFSKFPNKTRIVVSDSKSVKEFCNRNDIIVTKDEPVHLGAETSPSELHIDNLFLEWFIMAKSAVLGSFSKSKFSLSAIHDQKVISCIG